MTIPTALYGVTVKIKDLMFGQHGSRCFLRERPLLGDKQTTLPALHFGCF